MTGLPELPLAPWRPTKDTLHLYAQILGKIRLASAPPRNHWWHVPLYVTERGLTTRRLTHRAAPGGESFTLDLDLLEPAFVARTARGDVDGFDLHDGLSVRDFYRGVDADPRGARARHADPRAALRRPHDHPFDEDTEHASYDADAVRRFWAALRWTDTALEEFAGWFCGKTSPVHLFWHSFDLAVSRFSDCRVPLPPGTDRVSAEAYSHEVISFGFWAGDDRTPFPAFYSYTAPEPDGLTGHRLAPAAARWQGGPTGSLALLHYDDVRTAQRPARHPAGVPRVGVPGRGVRGGLGPRRPDQFVAPRARSEARPLTLPEVLSRRPGPSSAGDAERGVAGLDRRPRSARGARRTGGTRSSSR